MELWYKPLHLYLALFGNQSTISGHGQVSMNSNKPFKKNIHEIIFEADTPSGKLFDVILIASILLSVLVVMLDSVTAYHEKYGHILYILEWFFTILFTIEYTLRLYAVSMPLKYARSFFGIIDLLAIIPTYMSLFVPGSQVLLVIRALRMLRIWRILKLVNYLHEFDLLLSALRASFHKITVFLGIVVCLVLILGSFMYIIESSENGFTSIPRSTYWAIVTLTTVGYGDISPQTNLGQFIASCVMILGYAIIAIPTGIVSVEFANAKKLHISTQACPSCSKEGHDIDAQFCKFCGEKL